MKIEEELLPGSYKLSLPVNKDLRGQFVKTFAKTAFKQLGLATDFMEDFFSISSKNVLRGMHFQNPPHDHVKMVYCPSGRARDVLLDLRPGSGYGRHCETILDGSSPELLIIPKGVAHGFLSLDDNTLMVYKISSEYNFSADTGIHWNSFGHDWMITEDPVISERDSLLMTFSEFHSLF